MQLDFKLCKFHEISAVANNFPMIRILKCHTLTQPGQVIAAENPQPAFSAGEDLERKARCRRGIVKRRKIVMRHAPKIL